MQEVFNIPPYKIILEKEPGQNVVKLLKITLWGTDGPLYQHMNTEFMVSNMSGPLFFSIKKNEKMIGTCAFSNRKVGLKGQEYNAWYSRYFSIEPQSQGKIFANLLLKNIKTYFERISSEPTVFYAYVDKANDRSGKLLNYTGFRIIRNFETFAFSRVFPKTDNRVSRIKKQDKEKILVLLKEQYKDYILVNFDKLFFQDNYFTLKMNGEIVAGIQANPVEWKIRHLPGVSGKFIIRVLPHMPLVSRLFNPAKFRFAAFEAIYCKIGYEKELFMLMEAVCAQLNLYSGMIWMDSESELYTRIKKGKWGLINKLKENIPAHVVAAFKNISEEEQGFFYKKPAYISAFDLT